GSGPGRAGPRLGRDVSASRGSPADRARELAAGGDERVLLGRGRAGLRPPRGRAEHHRAAARRPAVAPARARIRMTVALLLAVGLCGAGTLGAASRTTFRPALALQAAGIGLLGAAGFWALAAHATAGSAFTSAFQPRL